MISFMIGVLGSTLFWVLYIILSLVMSMVIIKLLGNRSNTYCIFITGHKCYPTNCEDSPFRIKIVSNRPIDNVSKFWATLSVLVYAIIWPVIMGIYLPLKITKLIFTGILFKIFNIFFGKIPSVNIKFKEQED